MTLLTALLLVDKSTHPALCGTPLEVQTRMMNAGYARYHISTSGDTTEHEYIPHSPNGLNVNLQFKNNKLVSFNYSKPLSGDRAEREIQQGNPSDLDSFLRTHPGK